MSELTALIGPSRDALLCMRPRELRQALAAGHAIDPGALDESIYRGISLGLPSWIEALSWKTFVKTFHRDPARGTLRGWNVRLDQTGLDGALVYQRVRGGAPKTFGHYAVVAAEAVPAGCDRGLLIHYGRGGNPRLDPTGLLRDPIVALEPGSAQRLLGWSYVDVGFALPTPSFFLLERAGPLDHVAEPARG